LNFTFSKFSVLRHRPTTRFVGGWLGGAVSASLLFKRRIKRRILRRTPMNKVGYSPEKLHIF
jgi:hypothetical protein